MDQDIFHPSSSEIVSFNHNVLYLQYFDHHLLGYSTEAHQSMLWSDEDGIRMCTKPSIKVPRLPSKYPGFHQSTKPSIKVPSLPSKYPGCHALIHSAQDIITRYTPTQCNTNTNQKYACTHAYAHCVQII